MTDKEEALKQATSIVKRIEQLLATLDSDNPLANQLQLHKRNLEESRTYLQEREQGVAFIGAVGVGKTTAICKLLGLTDAKGNAVLSTSSGRTTLCEVEIRQGEQVRVLIEPLTEDQVQGYLLDFIDVIKLRSEGRSAADAESVDFPSEVERCIRNMLGLTIRRRKEKGKVVDKTDDALELYRSFNDEITFLNACREKLRLSERTTTELTCDTDEAMAWLKENFETVNHGRHRDTPMPGKITIEVNQEILGIDDLRVSVIDTKGLDGNVEREDIDRQFDSGRTVSVVCSKFNDAPEQAVQQLILHMIESGRRNQLASETILLVLDRDGESEKVMAEDGIVADAEEGRLVRQEQIEDSLRSKMRLNEELFPQICFYDAAQEESSDLVMILGESIRRMRSARVKRIEEIGAAVEGIELRRDQEEAKAAFEHVSNSIGVWAETSSKRQAEFRQLYKPLVDDMTRREVYASSIRAAIHRKGDWRNFDFYYKLAVAARKKTVAAFEQDLNEIRHVLGNLEKQVGLRAAHPFIREVVHTVEEEMQRLFENASFLGRKAFEDQMKNDGPFWAEQQGEWGQGSGYKMRVAQGTENWFHEHNPSPVEADMQRQIMNRWSEFIRGIEALLLKTTSIV